MEGGCNQNKSSVPPPATSSKTVIEMASGAHEFTITGYSLLKGMGFGKSISSDIFTVAGYDWAINFYPDGKSEEDGKEYVSMFIVLVSEGTDVRALFELKLIDQSGKGEHRIHSHFEKGRTEGPHVLGHRGSMWGYKRFLRRSQLEGSDYLKSDSLQIHCRVGVVLEPLIEEEKKYAVDVSASDMGVNFGQLLESGLGTDVSFVVGEEKEKFSAHKVVLAARSPVFMAQFFGLMNNEATDFIDVEDMEASAFKAMLHFVYWDALPEMHGTASLMLAQHVLAAADRYGLERLRLMCEAKLCENVAINNVATSLVLAEQHRCIRLKTSCLEFASLPENTKAVLQTDGFNHLNESCPWLINELLQYIAGIHERCVKTEKHEMDGGDVNGRRVKQRRN